MPRRRRLRGRRSERLGAITLAERPLPVAARAGDRDASWPKASRGSASTGCRGRKPLQQWRDRVIFLRRAEGDEWPDLSDAALAAQRRRLARAAARRQDRAGASLAPTSSRPRSARCCRGTSSAGSTPRRRRISPRRPARRCRSTTTREEGPKLSIRVQELFGLDRHPSIAGGKVPLVVELLSPAHRPVQVTRDLPGFWRGTYAAVKAEMHGRYPRHPWPDDPLTAPATRRAKPRGT